MRQYISVICLYKAQVALISTLPVTTTILCAPVRHYVFAWFCDYLGGKIQKQQQQKRK